MSRTPIDLTFSDLTVIGMRASAEAHRFATHAGVAVAVLPKPANAEPLPSKVERPNV